MLGNEITLVIAGNKVDLEKKRVIGNQSVILCNTNEITLVMVGKNGRTFISIMNSYR